MLIVKGIDNAINKFDGQELKGPDGKAITYKKALVDHLGAFGGGGDPQRGNRVSGEQMIKAFELGTKVHNAKGQVELDSDQAKFVTDAVTNNPLYSALIIGQVLKLLGNAEDTEKKEEESKEDKPAETPEPEAPAEAPAQ